MQRRTPETPQFLPSVRVGSLAAGHGSEDDEWFRAGDDRVGQRRIGWLVGEVLFARKEPDECSALFGVAVTECSTQNRVLSFERIKDKALGGWAVDLECHFAVDVRDCPEMRGENDSDHGNVCTSTESTAGRSRTIGAQLSPASADAYTWPPVVPKYTPQGSRASTAIASRRTLT